MVKLFETVKMAADSLSSSTPQLDAEVLMSYLLVVDRMYLYLNRDKELDSAAIDEYFKLINRRQKGEPVQYITGKQEFMSLDFMVKEGVLIPRNDTEILVEEVLNKIKDIKNPVIADVGCGSGAISVSLLKYKDDAKVYALDVMDIPLEVTKINALNNKVEDRIEIVKSDKLSSLIELNVRVDVVVSNPPYIKDDVIETLMTEVKDYEPYSALSGGKDGLIFYRDITQQSSKILKKDGLLAYEIGYDQREAVENILLQNEYYYVSCINDLSGNNRVITGFKK